MMANILATVLLFSALSAYASRAVSAQGQNVTCKGTSDCGGTDFGEMTAEDCCVNTPDAHGFSVGTACSPCIVLGFLQDSFTGKEETRSSVPVGYRKGEGSEIDFIVQDTPGTAREGTTNDYSVDTMNVKVQNAKENAVEFRFHSDSVAQERNETFTLRLEVAEGSTLPMGDNVFFMDEMNMVIVDNDMVEIEFTEEDFGGRERGSNPRVSVEVVKNKEIATRIILEVVPLTVEQAQSTIPLSLLPENIPTNNMFSPPYADSKDFNDTTMNITFEPDENASDDEREIAIPIFNDEINEAQEQAFVVQLRLVESVKPSLVRFTRSTSLCRIRDDDEITIGFEQRDYTYTEPKIDEHVENIVNGSGPIYLVKRGGVVSEQTFVAIVEVEDTAPDVSQPASFMKDYYSILESKIVTLLFLSNSQQLPVGITLVSDDIYERREGFQISFRFLDLRASRNISKYSPPSTDLTTATVIIEDDDAPPLVSFEKETYTALEEQGYVEVFFSTTSGHAQPIEVEIQPMEKDVDNAASGDIDFSLSPITRTFQGSVMGTTHCANITLIEDDLYEGDEQFLVRFGIIPSDDAGVGLINETTIIIQDDEIPEFNIGPNITVNESTPEVEICITTTSKLAKNFVVTAVTGPKSGVSNQATEDVDYDSATIMLTFEPWPKDDGMAQMCAKVGIIDDMVANEPDEVFSVRLVNVTSTENAEVCITIEDNDMLTVSFERDSYDVNEEDGTVEVCVFTNIGHTSPVEVVITPVVKDGAQYPATEDVDFSTDNHTVTFVPSSTSSRQCVNIDIQNDDIDEFDEQFLVRFGNLPNAQAQLGPTTETSVTIADEDVPIFNIDPLEKNVTEPVGMVEICITTNSELGREITVTAETGAKSGASFDATAGEDYSSTTFTFSFQPSGNNPQEMCGVVPINDDKIGNEQNESFSMTLMSATPDGNFGDRESCINIIDNDTPVVEWVTPEITILEGETGEICFNTNIGTAATYAVQVGGREKNPNPATSDDYEVHPSQAITIPVSPSGGIFCVNVTTTSDTEVEGDEQFLLHFVNLPSGSASVGAMNTVNVIIEDAAIPRLMPTCLITEPLRVKPFSKNTMYGFMGTCEHTALRSCDLISRFNVRVNIDFLTESMENGAVGLFVNNLRYVSREDGSFDDGGQTPNSSTTTRREYESSSSRIVVNIGEGMNNITYSVIDLPEDDPFFIEITVVHVYAGDNPFIQVNLDAPNDTMLNFCGLCGSRFGELVRPDGSIAQMMNLAAVQSFAQSYLVEPREQILRPQRRECGTVRNDTVIGDPLYTVPVYNEAGKEYSLCYEVFGRTNSTLNLVSDTCVSVNARYSAMDNPELGNIISSIGVRAKGMTNNSCHNIRVDLAGCTATVESPGSNPMQLSNMQSMQADGISVKKYPSRVRISAPNCENVRLVTWVMCENQNNQDMLKFVIARGVNLRASSHGLLGQFWNVPVTFTKYNGTDWPHNYNPEDLYVVEVQPESGPARSFLGEFYHLTWDKSRKPCLYVGTAQGGPTYEVADPNDSVIEGDYRDYIIDNGNLFETTYKYDQFDEGRC